MYEDRLLTDKFMDRDVTWGVARARGRPRGPQVRAPIVPLTDSQFGDYEALIAEVAKLNASGRVEEARRVAAVAANILRTSAPSPE